MIEATIIKGVDTSGYTIVTRIYDSSNLKIIGTKSYRNLSILPEFISTDSYMKIDGLETVSAAQDAINKKVIGTFGFGKKLKRENPRAFQRKFKKELGKF